MTMPRVTEVISPYIDKTWFTDESRERGQIIHSACACFARGLWSPPMPTEYEGFFISFEKWFSTFVKNVLLVEKTLTDSEMGFHGTPDIIVTMIDGVVTIPDYKTGAKTKTWAVQMAAYKHLAIKNGYPVERVGTLKLHPDGTMASFDSYEDSLAAFAAFHGALIAHQYFNQ